MGMLDNILHNTGVSGLASFFSGKTPQDTVSVDNIGKNLKLPQLQTTVVALARATGFVPEYPQTILVRERIPKAPVAPEKDESPASVKIIAMQEARVQFQAPQTYALTAEQPTVSHVAAAVLKNILKRTPSAKEIYAFTQRLLEANDLFAPAGKEIWNPHGTKNANKLALGTVLKIPVVTTTAIV